MFKTYYKDNGSVDFQTFLMTNDDDTGGRTTMMSNRCGSSMSSCNHQPQRSLQHSMKHKTINNQDIYRMNAAISEFQDSLTETIKVYQAGDKESFIEALKERQKKHFYVLEQAEQNPEFQKLFEGREDSQELSQQVWYFLEQYKKNQRLNEDWNSNREIQKAMIDSKYSMPVKQKMKLDLLRKFNEQAQKYQKEYEKQQEMLARLATSEKTKDGKTRPEPKPLQPAPKFNLNEMLLNMMFPQSASKSLGPKNTDLIDILSTPRERKKGDQPKSTRKPMLNRLDSILKNKPKVKINQSEEDENLATIALNVKKPYFKNDKRLKDKILIGEDVFQREYRQEILREGYTKLLKKIKQADLTLREIKNGQTLFDKDLMNVDYTNPYLKNPEMRNGLVQYIEATKPAISGDPNLNDFIERVKPLEVSIEMGIKPWVKEGQRKISIEGRKPTHGEETPSKTTKKSRQNSKKQFQQASNKRLGASSSRVSSHSQTKSNILSVSRSNNSATNSNERQSHLFLPQPHNMDVSKPISPRSPLEETLSRKSAGVQYVDDIPLTHQPIRLETVQHPFGLTKHETGDAQAKQISFPASPAFVNNYTKYKEPRVPKLVDVLAKKNIPNNFEEQTFYKIKQERQRFKQYAYTLNTCFETGRPSDLEVRIGQLNGTSKLPASVIGKNGVDKQVYMPMAADPQTTAKLQKALKQNGKGLGDIPSSFYEDKKKRAETESGEGQKNKTKFEFPQGSVINKLVGVRPYREVDRNTIREVFRTAERNKRQIINEFNQRIQAPLIVDQSPIPSLTQKQDLPPPKKRAKRLNDPLRRILKVNNEAFEFSKAMNAKVIKILERYELDKPIMMQDKLDMIWDKPKGKEPQSLLQFATASQFSRTKTNKGFNLERQSSSQSVSREDGTAKRPQNLDQRIVRRNLKTRKLERQQLNEEQVKVYQRLIDFLTQLRTKNLYFSDKADPSYALPEETIREFLDAFRIIIQSGYYIEQKDFVELINILKVQEKAQTKQQRLKIFLFFMHAAEQLRFDTATVETELTEAWVNEGAAKMITVESEFGGIQQLSFGRKTSNQSSASATGMESISLINVRK